jgi:serine/threonine protein kinase
MEITEIPIPQQIIKWSSQGGLHERDQHVVKEWVCRNYVLEEFATSEMTIKVLIRSKSLFKIQGYYDMFIETINKLATLPRCPFVISVLGYYKLPDVMCIVEEAWPNSTTLSNLSKDVPLKSLIQIWLDVAMGVEHLHNHGIVHGRLSSRNVRVNNEFRAAITDAYYETADKCSPDEYLLWHSVYPKPPRDDYWLAPETVVSTRTAKPSDRLTDIYSLGMLGWSILTQEEPYVLTDCRIGEIQLRPNSPLYSLPETVERFKGLPDCLQELICRCWHSDRDKRPQSLSEIISILQKEL